MNKLADAELFEVLRSLFQGANVMLCASTSDGSMILCNEHWTKALGHAKEAYLGFGWRDLTHPDDLDASKRNLRGLVDGTPVQADHSRLQHADGTYRWLRWHSWRGEGGLLFASAIEVTTEHERNLRMRHLEHLREASARIARIGVFEYEVAADKIWFSREVRRIHDAPKAIGPDVESCLALYPAASAEQLRKALWNAIAKHEPWDVEVPFVRPDGQSRWVRSFGEVELDADGSCHRVIGGFQDVTERREKDEVLAEALQIAEEAAMAQSAFMAAMSHEIRNPLHALLNIQTLLAQTPLTTEQHRLLRLMEDTGNTLSTLLNRVLHLSRLESGEAAPQSEPVDLAELCRSSVATQAPSRPDLAVRVIGVESLPVLGDPSQLRQVIDNLVSNALRYTLNGSVTVNVCSDALGQQITVTDTGVGIEPARHEVIFDRFRRVDPSSDRFQGGTGLGLSIARKLARGMNGELTVRSRLGGGSAFTLAVCLPAAAPLPPVPITTLPAPIFPVDTRVLVVDDEPVGRYIARRLLEQWGIEVIEASDGAMAVEVALREQPRLVFMDCIMPHTDGWSATEQLRSQGFQNPILALSGSGTEVDIAKAFGSGMNDHLCKPVRPPELLAALSFWLRTEPSGQHD